MRLFQYKKQILTIILTAALSLLAAIIPPISLRLIPDVISFEKQAQTVEADTELPLNDSENEGDGLYKHLSEIPICDTYSVCETDGKIYVYDGKDCLYRVKADIEAFPDDDRRAIKDGIEAHGYSQLSEIVSYMES